MVIWNVGFDTNNKTKSIAVNDAREWFDKGLVDINSNNLLEEMKHLLRMIKAASMLCQAVMMI